MSSRTKEGHICGTCMAPHELHGLIMVNKARARYWGHEYRPEPSDHHLEDHYQDREAPGPTPTELQAAYGEFLGRVKGEESVAHLVSAYLPDGTENPSFSVYKRLPDPVTDAVIEKFQEAAVAASQPAALPNVTVSGEHWKRMREYMLCGQEAAEVSRFASETAMLVQGDPQAAPRTAGGAVTLLRCLNRLLRLNGHPEIDVPEKHPAFVVPASAAKKTMG